jgi:hypothetical protein
LLDPPDPTPPGPDRWGPLASGGGARRRGEAGPERGKGGAHGDAEVAVRLTSGGAGEERRRGGGATALGGCGRRRAAAALRSERGGRVSAGIGGGRREEASYARN